MEIHVSNPLWLDMSLNWLWTKPAFLLPNYTLELCMNTRNYNLYIYCHMLILFICNDCERILKNSFSAFTAWPSGLMYLFGKAKGRRLDYRWRHIFSSWIFGFLSIPQSSVNPIKLISSMVFTNIYRWVEIDILYFKADLSW